jgi:hypothetical protein
MTCLFTGDSAQGQGSRSDQSLIGLSLTLGGIATHPRTGDLSADLALKHLCVKRANARSTAAAPMTWAQDATGAHNLIARQRGNGITSNDRRNFA